MLFIEVSLPDLLKNHRAPAAQGLSGCQKDLAGAFANLPVDRKILAHQRATPAAQVILWKQESNRAPRVIIHALCKVFHLITPYAVLSVLFRSIAVPSISQAFRIDTILMRIKARLFVSGAIQFSAFPQHFSTHRINALAFHSTHSSACLYVSCHFCAFP
jgi:hypothetical protein